MSYRLFQLSVGSRSISIISNNPEHTMIGIDALFRHSQTTWPYKEALDDGKVFLLGLQSFVVIGILIVLISTTSVYFMLRANMVEKNL